MSSSLPGAAEMGISALPLSLRAGICSMALLLGSCSSTFDLRRCEVRLMAAVAVASGCFSKTCRYARCGAALEVFFNQCTYERLLPENDV
jgi:hypothetical protein